MKEKNKKLEEALKHLLNLSTIIHNAESQGFRISEEDDAVWLEATEFMENAKGEK